MADATYQTKILRESGGDKIGIASGGEIDIESGGNVKSGAFHVVVG